MVQCNSCSGNSTITHLHVIVCTCSLFQGNIKKSDFHRDILFLTYVYMYEMNVDLMVGMVTQGGDDHV